MYDQFSSAYDHFVNWTSRLNYELPFIESFLNRLQTQPGRPGRVLDAACGTGWHVIALAKRGWQTTGADYSAGMIEQARLNAKKENLEIPFIQAGFGELAPRLQSIDQTGQPRSFDALLCLGNSLPHLLDSAALQAALFDFAACLSPGGQLFIQNRNFDLVMQNRQRWMEPQSHQTEDSEWLFLRFYDFIPNDLINFHVISLQRRPNEPWHQTIHTTQLRPLLSRELSAALQTAGFDQIELYGDMQGAAFDPSTSGNLIVTARLR